MKGLLVFEGYGLFEVVLVLILNMFNCNMMGSVGKMFGYN